MDELAWFEKKIDNINFINNRNMKNYPKIGIRPTIDGRQGGVRESLEEDDEFGQSRSRTYFF